MSLENVCNHFKYGYCKYKSKCKMNHVGEECKNESCLTEDCPKRHPKPCFYWTKFGNCKLGGKCAYKHVKSKEFESLEMKMNDMLEKSNKKDEIIKELLTDIKTMLKKNMEKDDIIRDLVKEVKELKLKSKEEENETTGNEKIDVFVKYSKKSLKHLDVMEADIKKSRKIDCMRKKFKMHSDQMEEDMYSHDLMMPPDLTLVHNVFFGDFNRGDYEQDGGKEDALMVINNCRETFERFLRDPVDRSQGWI